MKTIAAMPLCVLLFCGSAGAQDLLTANKAVERDIRTGESHSYTIALAAGDYAAGSIDQQGVAVLATVFRPDGSRLRGLSGPREGKRDLRVHCRNGRHLSAGAARSHRSRGGAVRPGRRCAREIHAPDRRHAVARRATEAGTRTDKYVSPAIEALRKQLAHGENSTDAFWQAQARAGTPLVEPIEERQSAHAGDLSLARHPRHAQRRRPRILRRAGRSRIPR